MLAPDEAAGAYAIDRSGGARVLVADADADDAAVILRHYGSSGEEARMSTSIKRIVSEPRQRQGRPGGVDPWMRWGLLWRDGFADRQLWTTSV